jgi:transposase-like protein
MLKKKDKNQNKSTNSHKHNKPMGKEEENDQIRDYEGPVKGTENEDTKIEASKVANEEDDQIRDYKAPLSEVRDEYKDDYNDANNNGKEEDDTSDVARKNYIPITERKINKQGKLILVMNDYNSSIDFTDISMETNDAIYVTFKDPIKINEFISKIRTNEFKSIYLIPIFLSGVPEEYVNINTDLCDGIYPNINEDKLIAKANDIGNNISLLKELKEEHYEKKILYKLLRYMFTRHYILEPYIDSSSTIGYIYPFLEIHYKGELLKDRFQSLILDEAERVGLIKSSFVDKVHICPQCSAGFHNFRELCPKCNSSNLSSQGLIHHFVCANVGPERDYKRANILVCPKCDRELRHIGVDYDKPSVIFECNDCGEHFQDANIRALCFNCKMQNSAMDLLSKDIKSYSITRYGIGIVKASLFYEEYSESKFQGCYSYNVFRELLGQEVKRVKTLKTQSICGSIHINISNSAELPIDQIENIHMAVSKELTSSPASLCFFEDIFTFLLPYSDIAEAKDTINHLCEAASLMINESFNNIEFTIEKNIIDIKIDDTEDELLNQMIINI